MRADRQTDTLSATLGTLPGVCLVTLSCTLSMRGRSESSNGMSPVTLMKRTTPRLHESDNIGLYGVPRSTSGATYAALPQYVELSTRRLVVCTTTSHLITLYFTRHAMYTSDYVPVHGMTNIDKDLLCP